MTDLRFSSPRGDGRVALVPMAEIARYERVASPSEINRRDLSRLVVVSANLDELPLGTGGQRALQAAERVPMAPGYRVMLAGDTERMAESFGYLAEALVLAVIFVYLILAAQFQSFIDPLSIMLSLPLSVVGMAGMLSLTGDTANIMSLIGLILLMGLVTKNAILLIDFTKVLRARGRGIDRCLIFRDNRDRDQYLERLGDILTESETPCYAWALMPNHFHLLLKTGLVPLASVMRRLLTGHAISFNRRHRRHGHLFQNRYKSILCQEEAYLRELVRYIHLNPLRAGLVDDIKALNRYPYSGHSALVGKIRKSGSRLTMYWAFRQGKGKGPESLLAIRREARCARAKAGAYRRRFAAQCGGMGGTGFPSEWIRLG